MGNRLTGPLPLERLMPDTTKGRNARLLPSPTASWCQAAVRDELLERRRQMVDRFRIQIAGQGEFNAFF